MTSATAAPARNKSEPRVEDDALVRGQGRFADDPRLPTQWSERKNVRWVAELEGRGWSSPIVTGGRVYVTTAVAATPLEDTAATAADLVHGEALGAKTSFCKLEQLQGLKVLRQRKPADEPVSSQAGALR